MRFLHNAHRGKNDVNILVTLDQNYIKYMNIMLFSLIHSNSDCFFNVYLLHSSVSEEDVSRTKQILEASGRLIMIKATDISLDGAPTTARYPKEIYYRIFAAKYLPATVDKILYLDPDIIVNGSIMSLYSIDMGEYFFAAASHTGIWLTAFNNLRLDMNEDSLYINSGVMLMNVRLLREKQRIEDVFKFIEKRKNLLILPDQDIISSLYGSKIYALDTFRYNMTEKLYRYHSPFEKGLNLDWVTRYSVIIHYCGRNKPWKENYSGQLDIFYRNTVEKMEERNLISD